MFGTLFPNLQGQGAQWLGVCAFFVVDVTDSNVVHVEEDFHDQRFSARKAVNILIIDMTGSFHS